MFPLLWSMHQSAGKKGGKKKDFWQWLLCFLTGLICFKPSFGFIAFENQNLYSRFCYDLLVIRILTLIAFLFEKVSC